MFATGADPQSERTRFRAGSRIWGLIRRTLPLGRSIGSLFYLISVGLIAGWVIAVFFGVSFYFLMPGSAKLVPGLNPDSTRFSDSSAETLRLTQSTSRLDRLSGPPPPEPPHPMVDDAADKGRPVLAPGSLITANVKPHPMPAEATAARTIGQPTEPAPGLNRGQALTVELGTLSAAPGEVAPVPSPQTRPSTAPEPRGASPSSHSRSSRKPLARRPANTRTAQPHAPVNAINDVLQKHSHVLK
jgi:hypothetical protein